VVDGSSLLDLDVMPTATVNKMDFWLFDWLNIEHISSFVFMLVTPSAKSLNRADGAHTSPFV